MESQTDSQAKLEGAHRFLVSTHNHLFQLAITADLEEGSIAPIASGARYYGIARTPSGEIYVVKNTRRTEDETKIVSAQTDEEIEFETPIKDVHQMSYGNGGLYLCNTYYNSVIFKSLRDGTEHSYTIGGVFEHDYAHPNSLWIDGIHIYVLLHNKRFRTSELCRIRHNPASGFDRGYRSEIRYKLPYQACHNIRFDGPLLTFLASENESVAQMNHLTGEMIREFPNSAGYIKGMTTFGENKLLVGMNPLVPTDERYVCDAAVGVIDTLDGGTERCFPLKMPNGEGVANINEIRRLS